MDAHGVAGSNIEFLLELELCTAIHCHEHVGREQRDDARVGAQPEGGRHVKLVSDGGLEVPRLPVKS